MDRSNTKSQPKFIYQYKSKTLDIEKIADLLKWQKNIFAEMFF